MDASDPETRQELERSLKDLAWIRRETKDSLDEAERLLKETDMEFQLGKISPDLYSRKKRSLEVSQETVLETLRMIQRQRTLITGWLLDAER